MYNYKTISADLNEKGIKTYNVETGNDFVLTGICFLNYEDFLGFIKDNGINDVFIYEVFIENENYMISRETICNVNVCENMTEAIRPLIESYNEKLRIAEFDIPKYVFLISVWNNQKFYFEFQNEISFMGEKLLEPEEKIIELVEDNISIIEYFDEAKEEAIEAQIKEIKAFILQDKEFQKCTNQQRRYDYLRNLLRKNKKYATLKQHWMPVVGLYNDARYFIDDVWQELKKKSK